MPADKEIHLGFIGPEAIYDFAERLGLPVSDYFETPKTLDELRAADFDVFIIDTSAIEPALKAAFDAVASRLGWAHVETNENGYEVYDTPYGRRTTSGFALGVQYDPDEIGDETSDATIGVNLSARYYPCILDAKNEHGTLGTSIDFEELGPMVAICREELEARIPQLQGARVFFRDIFY